MKKATNCRPIFMALLLIAVGTLSPSDGVDSGKEIAPADMLLMAGGIVLVGVLCFLLLLRLRKEKVSRPQEVSVKQEQLVSLTTSYSYE